MLNNYPQVLRGGGQIHGRKYHVSLKKEPIGNMHRENRSEPKIDPCGTPQLRGLPMRQTGEGQENKICPLNKTKTSLRQ